MTNEIFIAVVIAVPTAAIGFSSWLIQRRITISDKRQEEQRNEHESKQSKWWIIQLQSSNAALDIGIATAQAVRDGHCNGNVSTALKVAADAKREQAKFLMEQGVKNVNSES